VTKRTHKDRLETAVHEAAHAVIWLDGGVGVGRITIRGSGNQHFASRGMCRAKWILDPDTFAARMTEYKHLLQVPEVRAFLAGTIAGGYGGALIRDGLTTFTSDTPTPEEMDRAVGGAWHDLDRAIDTIIKFAPHWTREQQIACFTELAAEAATLFVKHREWIRRVAEALMERTTITGDDALALRDVSPAAA
jgi:hypothetical protein